MKPFYIRLIIRVGLFLYYKESSPDIVFTENKDSAKLFNTRDDAIEVIKQLNDKTQWKYNFEIVNY